MDPGTLTVTALAVGAARALREGMPAAQALIRLVDTAGPAAGKHPVALHASRGMRAGGSQHLCAAAGR